MTCSNGVSGRRHHAINVYECLNISEVDDSELFFPHFFANLFQLGEVLAAAGKHLAWISPKHSRSHHCFTARSKMLDYHREKEIVA